jgi:hypothetical protein
MRISALSVALLLMASACAPSYTLVAGSQPVSAGGLSLSPGMDWNRAPGRTVPGVEAWTLNGMQLDRFLLISGLKDGQVLVKQAKKTAEKVPTFRSNMNPQDVAGMLESFYRIKTGANDFSVTGLSPAQFAGGPGFKFEFYFVDKDDVKRRGRASGSIKNGALTLLVLDAASLHYFDAAAPEFDRIAASAKRI